MSNTTKARRAQGLEAKAHRAESVITRLKQQVRLLQQQRGQLMSAARIAVADIQHAANIFNSPHFTDRYKDGPRFQASASTIRDLITTLEKLP